MIDEGDVGVDDDSEHPTASEATMKRRRNDRKVLIASVTHCNPSARSIERPIVSEPAWARHSQETLRCNPWATDRFFVRQTRTADQLEFPSHHDGHFVRSFRQIPS